MMTERLEKDKLQTYATLYDTAIKNTAVIR